VGEVPHPALGGPGRPRQPHEADAQPRARLRGQLEGQVGRTQLQQRRVAQPRHLQLRGGHGDAGDAAGCWLPTWPRAPQLPPLRGCQPLPVPRPRGKCPQQEGRVPKGSQGWGRDPARPPQHPALTLKRAQSCDPPWQRGMSQRMDFVPGCSSAVCSGLLSSCARLQGTGGRGGDTAGDSPQTPRPRHPPAHPLGHGQLQADVEGLAGI